MSIYKRGNVWYSSVFIDGKRVRKPLDTNKQIAEAKLQEMIEQKNASKFGRAPLAISLEAFRKIYFKHRLSLGMKGLGHDKTAFAKLAEIFPIQKVSQITPELLSKCSLAWIKKGDSPSLVKRRMQSLLCMMKLAEEWGYVPAQNWNSVASDIKVSRGPQDPYEFQSWTVGLLFFRSLERRGADDGVDCRLICYEKDENKKFEVIIQIKSGQVSARDVRELWGTIERHKVQIGVLLSRFPASRVMRDAASKAGCFVSAKGSVHPRIQVLSAAELAEGTGIDLPNPTWISIGGDGR